MIVYNSIDQIPLNFERVRNSVRVSGLTVTVAVKNAQTGATLLASTSVPEVAAGSGIYGYLWSHGQSGQVTCEAAYSVGGVLDATEIFLITNTSPSRSF